MCNDNIPVCVTHDAAKLKSKRRTVTSAQRRSANLQANSKNAHPGRNKSEKFATPHNRLACIDTAYYEKITLYPTVQYIPGRISTVESTPYVVKIK